MLLNALISNSLLDILHGRQLAFQFFRQVAGDLIGTDTDGLAHIFERIRLWARGSILEKSGMLGGRKMRDVLLEPHSS